MNKKVKKLWSKIPSIKCQRKCHATCGVIIMSEAEKKMIIDRIGHDPFIEQYIAIYSKIPGCLSCPLLKDEKCSIYDIRPAVCRIYGAVKKMQCPHGCIPDKWLSDEKGREILSELGMIK